MISTTTRAWQFIATSSGWILTAILTEPVASFSSQIWQLAQSRLSSAIGRTCVMIFVSS